MSALTPTRLGGYRTPLDFLFFTRPVLMPPVWTIALLGVATAPVMSHTAVEWTVFFVQLWCLFGAVYTLNQICDVESDRLNRKLFFLPDSIITIRAASILTISLNLMALALASLLGGVYLSLTAVIIILGVVYSVGKSPWKNRPILGFLANSAAHGAIVYAMGLSFAAVRLTDMWITAVAYGCAVGAVYLATTVADVPGDAAESKRTIAVSVGGRTALIVASLLVCGSLLLAIWQGETALSMASALSLPVFVWAASQDQNLRALKAAKVGIVTLTLGAAIYFPAYLIVMGLGFFATRLFFSWRFGMSYPTFR